MIKLSSLNNDIRAIIIDKKKEVGINYNDPKKLVILINPTVKASYHDMVMVLDE